MSATKEEAEGLFAQLRECLSQQGDEPEDGVEVATFDNVHHYVMFTINGRRVALDSDLAREIAEELWDAARVADKLMAGHRCATCPEERTHTGECVHSPSYDGDQECQPHAGVWSQPNNYYVSEARAQLNDDAPWCRIREVAWELHVSDE